MEGLPISAGLGKQWAFWDDVKVRKPKDPFQFQSPLTLLHDGDLCQIPPAAMATADPGGLVSDGSCPRSLSSSQNAIPQVFNPAIMGLDSKLEFNQYLLVRASVYRHLLSLATKVFMTRQTCFHCPLSLLHRRQEAMPQTERQTI